MSTIKSISTKADILLLIVWRRNGPREVSQDGDEQSDDADNYKETDRLLGDESGAEDDIPETVMVRRNKRKPKKKKLKKPSLSGVLWSGLFGISFGVAVTCKLLHDALLFIQPQLLR